MKLAYFITYFFCLVVVVNNAEALSSNRNYCIGKCFATWNCYDDSSRSSCEQSRNFCVADCANIPDDQPQKSGGGYSAIAYSKQSGAWGLADESTTPEAAKKSALDYCKKHANDCAIAETFSNTCVAIAIATDGVIGWNSNSNVNQAIMNAIKNCGLKTKSGTRCFLKSRRCYFK